LPDGTGGTPACFPNLNQVHAMYLTFDAGSANEIDNITAH